MKKAVSSFLLVFIFSAISYGQSDYGAVQNGEFGVTAGVAHYFGDINNRGAIDRPKMAVGAFFRKQFGNYISMRVMGHYAKLGYSDVHSANEFQRRRNLSFNTDIYEFALTGDFNFFKFLPSQNGHAFTPYATLGIGVFSYDPYAYYQGEKVFLRPLSTEGQTFYDGRKAYKTMAICYPIGFGFKYALSEKMNISFEVTHRFTNTDYIDDVSTTYVGIDKFPSPSGKSLAGIMQDRSYVTGVPIGVEGRQRGFSKQKDQYIIAEVGISFNISSYECPTAK
ncbi:MAG: DUF6089 family protein [Ginsengibacter sp.]|jgi:hypothetical protein